MNNTDTNINPIVRQSHRREKGFTITELTAVITIMSFITLVAGVGLSVFFSKYRELSMYSDLQHYAFSVIHQMKFGYPVSDGQTTAFLGVGSADDVSIPGSYDGAGTSNSLRCEMSSVTGSDLHENDRIIFEFDQWNGKITAYYQYGLASRQVVLFPLDYKDNLRVTDLKFRVYKVPTTLVEVWLEAELKVTKDLKKVVKYHTTMCVAL